MLEQQKVAQRELELKKPIDKKNPWGVVAERWAGESRGKTGRVFDEYMDSCDRITDTEYEKDDDYHILTKQEREQEFNASVIG